MDRVTAGSPDKHPTLGPSTPPWAPAPRRPQELLRAGPAPGGRACTWAACVGGTQCHVGVASQGECGLGLCVSGICRGSLCLLTFPGGLAAPVSLPACPTCPFAPRPMLIDMNKVYRQTNLENLDQAFSVAERDLGVTRLLDPEGMCHCPLLSPRSPQLAPL